MNSKNLIHINSSTKEYASDSPCSAEYVQKNSVKKLLSRSVPKFFVAHTHQTTSGLSVLGFKCPVNHTGSPQDESHI